MNKCAFCLRFVHKDYTFIWFKIHMSISSKNGYKLTFFPPKAISQGQFIYFLVIRLLITIHKWASIDVSISTTAIDPWLDFGFWMFTYLFVVYRWHLKQNEVSFSRTEREPTPPHRFIHFSCYVWNELFQVFMLLRAEWIIKHSSVTKATCSMPPCRLWGGQTSVLSPHVFFCFIRVLPNLFHWISI